MGLKPLGLGQLLRRGNQASQKVLGVPFGWPCINVWV